MFVDAKDVVPAVSSEPGGTGRQTQSFLCMCVCRGQAHGHERLGRECEGGVLVYVCVSETKVSIV